MKPLHVAVVMFSLAYGACLVLHAACVGAAPAGAGAAWYAWRFAGAACLSSTCAELIVWLTWVWLRRTGASTAAGVPLRLTPIDRFTLLRRRPPVALLMPAHNEATTEEDREALVRRIFETLLRTPSWSTFFLLADSPESQRENESSVVRQVRRRLRAAGRGYFEDRLVLEEYRDKPPHWRHKCGSLLAWLRRHGGRFEYMFVLDADSSLPPDDPHRPQDCDVVERMVVAMEEDPTLAMVQSAIRIRGHGSLWGALQALNARVGADYYFPVFSHVYGRACPCYGHNCLLRVSDFAAHVRNTLEYTSHDHVDSADLAAAGRGCVLTSAAVTYEEAEDTLTGWLKRECRWSRGNGQWLVYLLRKRPLPLGVGVYMVLGIMQYVWALLAGVLLVSAAVLLSRGEPMVADPDGPAARLLAGLVLFTMLVPRLAAAPSVGQVLISVACSVVLGPTLVLYQGVCFLLGAFGSKWVPRGARSTGFGPAEAARTAGAFFPAMLLGLVLWGMMAGRVGDAGGALVSVMVIGMVLSPVAAVLLSWPTRRRPRGGAGGVTENLSPCTGVTVANNYHS